MRIPETAPRLTPLLLRPGLTVRLPDILAAVDQPVVGERYLHWDEIRFRHPPAGLSREEWWLGLKMRREASRRAIPLLDDDAVARPFTFCVPEMVADLLHQIDRDGGNTIKIPEQVTSPEHRDRYIVRSLVEEAITSSQLEGAATTREVAKKMLVEGREPRDRSERMIFNNYATMQRIVELKNHPLTPELVFEIHREVSRDTLDITDGAGRFRRSDERIEVADEREGTVFHTPPPAKDLPARLAAMCDFANAKTPDYFVHPVIRGILLHFWLAYDHPFVDGNGRTARALFYWQMLHAGYWLFEFISISQFLRQAPVQYGTAFLHTETDENDLTYFIIHQAGVIRRALKELHDYVARKSSETRACLDLLQKHPELNHRQQALVAHALRHPGFAYGIAGHAARHVVVYQTARTDLLALARSGLLDQRKAGRAMVFIAPKNLEEKLRTNDRR